MRLQATFSKGTLVFENQHPDSASGLINKYVSLDRHQIIFNHDSTQTLISDSSVKTRPIGRIKNGQPHYETYDSTFFDLTIHKHKNKSMDSVFYIGILNKRTDPLIMMDSLPTEKHLLFLTDDEFGKLCRTGGKDPTRPTGTFYDSTYWQSKWWKRLGAREITVPFTNSMKEGIFDGSYNSIAEIGADNDTLNSYFWRQHKYYDLVDTIIRNIDTLKIRFLPGEGKLLKTEPKKLFTSNDENDSTDCESCEAFTKNIKIARSNQSGTNPKCFTITINNDSDCDYSDLNIVLKINGITNANVTSSNFSLTTHIIGNEQVVNVNGTLNNNTSKTLTFCFPANSPNFNYQLFAGIFVKGQFVLCDTPLTEYEYIDSCRDCNTISVNVVDKSDSCECACDYRIQINTGMPNPSCAFNSWGYELIENGDTTSITGLTVSGTNFYKDICLRDGSYKLKVNFFRNGKIVCAKYIEKDCNLCDSITVKIERLIYENGAIYAPGSARITINLRNLDNCITDIGGNLVMPRPTNGADLIVIEGNVPIEGLNLGQTTRTIHFLNSEGDTICSKTFTFGSPIYTENLAPMGIVKNIEDLGGLCCSEVIIEELDTNTIDIYSVMIYDPVTMIPYYNEARNPNTASPFDFSGSGHYFTDVCAPADSSVRFNILLYSADTTLVAHLSFDSLCTSNYYRSSSNIESMSLYPNPTIDKVTLEYELKEDAEVEIELLDHKGNIVSTDKLKTKKKGKHSYEFNFKDNQISIVYILLRANGEEKIMKQLIYK